MQRLNRGICAPGLRQQVDSVSGDLTCVRKRSWPEALIEEIGDPDAVTDHGRYCGKWIAAGSIAYGDQKWAWYDAKETERDIDNVVRARGASRIAATDLGKFRASCRTMVASNSAGASAKQAYDLLVPGLNAESLGMALESVGFLASHYCDTPALVGVGTAGDKFATKVLAGTVLSEKSIRNALYVVGESREVRDEAIEYANAMADFLHTAMTATTQDQAEAVVRGSYRGTWVEGYVGPSLTIAYATSNYPLERFVSAFSSHGAAKARSYVKGVAAVCSLAAQSVVVSEVGQLLPLYFRSKAPLRAPRRGDAIALGRLVAPDEEKDAVTEQTMLNASTVRLSALAALTSASRTSAREVCLAAAKRVFPDDFDRITFNALVTPALYERLGQLAELVREAAAVTLSEDLIGGVFDDYSDRNAASAKIRATKVRIAGAPRGTWAGIDREFRRPDLASDDSALTMIVKQARAVFLDRLLPVVTSAGICEHPAFYAGSSRNAYLLLTSNSACSMILPGLIVPPFADERYDDASLVTRLGFVMAHEFMHVTALKSQWDDAYIPTLLDNYPQSTYVEAIADVGAAATVLRFASVSNETLCASVSQLFCGRVGWMPLLHKAPPPWHPPTNMRGDNSRAGIDADEAFGSQELALSSYLKLHPVLSLESTSFQTLQLVANLVEGTSIPTKELEIVPKPHDDSYLRPPNLTIGERPCCFGDRCICVWLARWRYGDDTDMAYMGTEFLLPTQAFEFKKSGKLPPTNGKCLVCSRYVTTYIYRCARADPTFKPDVKIPLQAYGNSLGVVSGEDLLTHASVANDADGYRQEAMLFVDEQWADTSAARGGMASLMWRPCVKFDSAHYVYVKDTSGLPRMLQRNMGAEDEAPASHFYQPAAGQSPMMKRSRSVFEPITLPMHADFEDAGMAGAMSRLLARLRMLVDSLELPSWLWSLDFGHAVTACATCADASALIGAMADIACTLSGGDGNTGASDKRAHTSAPTAVQMAARARLHFGEMMEALATSAASALVPAEEVPGVGMGQAGYSSLALLYYDSYCAALWTSAHAEFLATTEDLLDGRAATDGLMRELMVPPPDLYTVTNVSNLAHLGALSERITSPRCCTKSSQSLLAILARVTNAGSRGWETTLLAAAKDSEGAVRVCMQCIAVALTGMHPAIHPAVRRPWRERFVSLRALRVQTQNDFKDLVHNAPTAIKEAIRLHLAAMYVLDCATLDAMRHTRQPTGQLGIPPLALPHPSLSAAMHRMADAGAFMLEQRGSAAIAIQRYLVSEPRSRKKSDSRYGTRHPRNDPEPLSYCSSWLGGRSGPLVVTNRSSVQVVGGLLSASYRSIYIPFWLHGNHHGHRASRLDSAQYAALHNCSAAHRMCTLLSTEDFQLAERVAIDAPDASLLTVSEACALLSIRASADEPPGVPCSASSRVVQEAEVDVMNLCARDAALLIAFARIAALRATMLSYDLGEGTRRRQALAICQRMLLPLAPGEDPCKAVRTRLPQHATVLYCCSECRRVVNSVQDNTGKEQSFNELGLAASMLTIDGDLCDGHMRCAKRSSAALRTAVALEAAAETLELERLDPVPKPLLPTDLRPATIVATMCKSGKRKASASKSASVSASALRDSSSEVAKFRRDLKSCFEQGQEATSCGDVPLVRVPILGRTIRLFGNWYALCSMCGTLARVTPASRFRGDICCMRCDFAMLAGKEAAEEMRNALPRPPPPYCRFCHKVEPENGAGMKWKCVDAPLDTGGHNACVPPPLRTCWYCPSHYRAWLVNAHKTMRTADIISHLVNKARPIHGASAEAKAGIGGKRRVKEDGQQTPPKRQSALTKRKVALTRVIAKNNRKRRLNGGTA